MLWLLFLLDGWKVGKRQTSADNETELGSVSERESCDCLAEDCMGRVETSESLTPDFVG